MSKIKNESQTDILNQYSYQNIRNIFDTETDNSIADNNISNDRVVFENTLPKYSNQYDSVLPTRSMFKAANKDLFNSWNNATVNGDWFVNCQFPVFIVLFAVLGVLAVTCVILLWLKKQMYPTDKNRKSDNPSNEPPSEPSTSNCPCRKLGKAAETEQWVYHTVMNLQSSPDRLDATTVQIQPLETVSLPSVLPSNLKSEESDKITEPVRIKTKGLLERRGSSASLTIELPQTNFDGSSHMVTPTRECSTEEFLLSAGNVLSRSDLRNCFNNINAIHHEFWDIPLNHPEQNAYSGCGIKNRYRSILPNDRTRVKIPPTLTLSANPLDEYINANFIKGYDNEEKAYIATQGPLHHTVVDFYRMIWNEKCSIIVMITKLWENGKSKCEMYFPVELNDKMKINNFVVTNNQIDIREGYIVRHLLVEHDGESRNVLHYWYDTWPDHKTPMSAENIVAVAIDVKTTHELMKNIQEQFGPVLVHCSAGIGRTGCFIAISIALQQLLAENKVDILGIVCQIRYDRGGMVQTSEQYEFIHTALSYYERRLADKTP